MTEDLDRLLARNADAPTRERIALIRISEELRALATKADTTPFADMRGAGPKRIRLPRASAFVPLTFAAGEAYQFWSHEIVVLNDVATTVKVAHVCHSRMMFVRAYPCETQEMVFDAHEQGFAFFKGA